MFFLYLSTVGVWLLTSLYSHESAKGMRVKFQDVECFRELEYDLVDGAGGATSDIVFTLWNPPTLDEIKKEDEKPKPPITPPEADDYTDQFAAELGLRSMKNQSRGSVEEIDLSYFDYVDHVDTNISLALTEELNKNDTSLLNLTSQNETTVEVKTLNCSAIPLQNTSYSENTTYVWNSTVALTSDNFSVHDTTNTRVSATVSPKSNSASANNSASDTENASVHNTTEISLAGNASTETPNLDLPSKGSSAATLTSTGHSEDARVDATLAEDSVEQLTRGDVFLYFPPSSNESATAFQNASENTVLPLSKKGDEEDNQTEVDSQYRNWTSSQLETASPLNGSDSLVGTADLNYSLNVTNSSLENVTDIWLELADVTATVTTSNSSAEVSWGSAEDATALLTQGNETSLVKEPSDENPISAVSGAALFSDELGTSESAEEVVIYLKENKTHPIKTTSVKVPTHNWTYEGTHQTETMEIPDYLLKYLGKEIPRLVSKPKRTKKVNLRQWPGKGQGMKTKRRKAYKPQPASTLPFSPRGFHPGMTPRGSRPVSDEEELINTPLVIGVPRPDFSDYELYVPGNDPERLSADDQNESADEYEYVNYNDPYGSHEDVKTFYHTSGPNTRVYFIAVEEVEWDYGGYGQR